MNRLSRGQEWCPSDEARGELLAAMKDSANEILRQYDRYNRMHDMYYELFGEHAPNPP